MWRSALDAVKEFFKSKEYQDEDGLPSKDKIAAHAAHMLEETGHGYRLVYLDTVQQVSLHHLGILRQTLS